MSELGHRRVQYSAHMSVGDPGALRLSVCIVTYERPEFLRRCLAALRGSSAPAEQIVVVDASAKEDRGAAADDPSVVYVWAPELAGWMTRSRNEALRWATGDVIAFLDDDVCVHPGWAQAVRDGFSDPAVAAAGGRTLNGLPGEEASGEPIGRYLPRGRLTSGFAQDATSVVEMDHGIGANMAFRRSVLAELGGFRDDYPGTALREDTDMFLRVRSQGRRVVFLPNAVVDHRPAPHVVGQRFDTRYKLYGRRNHLVLLARHEGIRSPVIRQWVVDEFARVVEVPGTRRRALRLGVTMVGVAWGLGAMVSQARWGPSRPQRFGEQAEQLRVLLGEEA